MGDLTVIFGDSIRDINSQLFCNNCHYDNFHSPLLEELHDNEHNRTVEFDLSDEEFAPTMQR